MSNPVAWREAVGTVTRYYDYNEDGRGEPLYLHRKGEEHMKYALPVSLGFFVGVIFTVLATKSLRNDDYKVHIESYQMGQKHALRLNPVSWELEETCVALWMGKEDAKAR